MNDFLDAAPKRKISEAHKAKLRENAKKARAAYLANVTARRVAEARRIVAEADAAGSK